MKPPWRRLTAVAAAVVWLGVATTASAASGFAGWAGLVAAGDDRSAHGATPTSAFENARQDVSAAFVARGFSRADLAELSMHPERYPLDHAHKTSIEALWDDLAARTSAAAAGCLIYITSHGSPDGVVVADHLVPPALLAALISRTCGARPTAVILSACFSGVFLPALEGPNRLVFTAARRDRSSFGCGEKDRYPYFDGCVIQDLPAAQDFPDLADRVKRCVAQREDAEGTRPRSQPQLFVGAAFRASVPRFDSR